MGRLPFTEDQFFQVFAAYNRAVWPAPVVLTLLALGVAVLVWRRPGAAGPWAAWFLAALWTWTGAVYHLLHFLEINPAAVLFGALFLIQGGLILWWGGIRGALRFRPPSGWRGALAGGVLAYALVVYPLIGVATGHGLFTGPTFGAPCPAVIYTLGLFLLVRDLPPWLLLVPVIWALVGSSAVFAFAVWQDAGLLLGAVLTTAVVIRDRVRERRHPRRASAAP